MQRNQPSQPAASNTPSASPVSANTPQPQSQASSGAASKAGVKPQTTPPPPPRAVEAANQVQIVAAKAARNPAMAQPGGKPMSPSGQPRTSGGKPPSAVVGHGIHMPQQPVPHFSKPIVTNQTGPGPGQRPNNIQNPTNMDQWNRFPNTAVQMAGISNLQPTSVPNIRQASSLTQLNQVIPHPQQQTTNSLQPQQVVHMPQQQQQQINNQPDPALQQLLDFLKNSRQSQDQKKVS